MGWRGICQLAETAEHFARTINRLKGQTTMLCIAHMLPKALLVDEVVRFGGPESVNSGGKDAKGPGGDRGGRLVRKRKFQLEGNALRRLKEITINSNTEAEIVSGRGG